MNPLVGVSKFGISAGSWFTWFIKFGFTFLFVVYLIAHAVSLGIQQKDITVTVTDLGREFWSPLQTAQEMALEIQQSTAQDIFHVIWDYWGFIFIIYKLYIIISIIVWLVAHSPLSTLDPFKNFLLGLVFFYVLEIIYMAVVLKISMNTPFIATYDVGKAILHLVLNTNINFSPIHTTGNVVDTCTVVDGVCVI